MPRGPHIVLYPCGACGKRGAYLLGSGGLITVRCRLCKAQGHWSVYLHDVSAWRPEDFAAQIRAAPLQTGAGQHGTGRGDAGTLSDADALPH
jgi:hypothetical protein